MSNQVLNPTAESAPDTSFNPDTLAPEIGADLLEQVSAFIGRYLECSEHQRTVMALWVLHTHCLPAAQVTPYLAIQSAARQSGKTLCLQLLRLLCADSALTTGFTAASLSRRTDGPIPTILLDECQATLGTRTRSKGPVLRAVLAGGYHSDSGYTAGSGERNVFAPKAFAGMGRLPEVLADRSISIILEPLKPGPQPPGPPARAGLVFARDGVEAPSAAVQKIQRFNLRRASEEAKPLQDQLHTWADGALDALEARPPYSPQDFPPDLSPRRQDMIEPLLQLAGFIGGEWPARIRAALAGVFQEEGGFDLKESLQLLADIRDCFAHHGYPQRLPTSALLEWLHSLLARSWDVDGPITARRLAGLLFPLEVHPRLQRIGSASPSRGYELHAFMPLWQARLGFDPASVTHAGHSEIDNRNAGCNTVTDSGDDFPKPPESLSGKPPERVLGPEFTALCRQDGVG